MLLNSLLSITLAISSALTPSTSDIPATELRGQLAALVDDRDITAGLIHVRDGPNRWSDAVGVRDLTSGMPAVATAHFRIGSVTKTFAATVLLQLVDEGRLTLDDPVEEHLPGVVPNGPSELLEVAFANDPTPEPDTYVIEKLTGHTYGEEVGRRILRPLKLTHTSVPGHRASLPTPHAHGYEPLPTDPPTIVDATRMDPSLDWAAGEMISTTGDLATFVTALLDGRLTSRESLAEMRRTTEADSLFRYGLGLTDGEGRSLVVSLNPYEQDPPTEGVLPMAVSAFCR